MYYVCSKKGNKYGIKDTDDGVIEYFTPDVVLKLAKKVRIYGVVHQHDINIIKYDFSTEGDIVYRLKIWLKKAGVRLGESDEISSDKHELLWECRFLGGFGNWYCSWVDYDDEDADYDNCDADTLEKSIVDVIVKVCNDFSKETGLHVKWYKSGEKCWSGFHIS